VKLTDDEILTEVESLIEDFRLARGLENDPNYRAYHALKAVASDICGRRLDRIGEAQRELAAALDAAERSKTQLGFLQTTLSDVAYKTRAYWPTIKQALEFFEDARKVDAQ
jgi:hypothetical protein